MSEWVIVAYRKLQLYYDENKWIFNEMMKRSALHQTNTLSWICIVYLTETSPQIEMLSSSDTLFWYQANQSLLFLLNAAFLAEKQQMQIA